MGSIGFVFEARRFILYNLVASFAQINISNAPLFALPSPCTVWCRASPAGARQEFLQGLRLQAAERVFDEAFLRLAAILRAEALLG